MRFAMKARSSVSNCETLATEGFDKPVLREERDTFPGADANFRLDVTTATITVPIRLSLKLSDEMISTGRR